MAYDEGLAERLREVFADIPFVHEKKMFGGLAFMVDGHMSCGVMDDGRLMLRVGPAQHDEVLRQPHVLPMDFTGRPMKGLVFLQAEAIVEDADLERWIQCSLRFVQSLPPKAS